MARINIVRTTGRPDEQARWVAPAVTGVVIGSQAERQWRAACDVYKTLTRIRPRLEAGQLKDVAARTLSNRGPEGSSGAFGQLRGHLFEHMDIRDFNLRQGARRGYRLVQRTKPHNPGYDATRWTADGKFAGAVQHKSGPTGFDKAIGKLESKMHGSARKATFRVPKDQAEACTRAAKGRTRVEASRLTNREVSQHAEGGLREIATRGPRATSLAHQAARAAGKASGVGAATSVAIGGVVDLRALLRHDLNARQFVARRGVDAAEGGITAGITAAVTTTAVAGIGTGATLLASTAAAGTVVAAVAGTVAASPVVVPAAVSIAIGLGVGYGVSRAAGPARRYVTDRFQSPAGDAEGPFGATLQPTPRRSSPEQHASRVRMRPARRPAPRAAGQASAHHASRRMRGLRLRRMRRSRARLAWRSEP